MEYKYEDFNNYTLEESLEILRAESTKRRIKANDLIIGIEKELKNQDESVAKCSELIQEIINRLNQDNKMICPVCQESCMIKENNITTRNIVEKLFKELEELDNKYNNISNINIFELAVYLYIRYGEIPVELYDKLEELSRYFNNKESIFCEDINYEIENIIIGGRDNES